MPKIKGGYLIDDKLPKTVEELIKQLDEIGKAFKNSIPKKRKIKKPPK